MARHLIFDTETSDLVSNTIRSLDLQPEIFEWYSIVLDTDKMELVDELHLFSKPKGKIAKGASKATGKKDEDFVNYPPFADGADKIKSMVESCDLVIAHNLNFDVTVTDFEFARIGKGINWPEKRDTVSLTEWIFGYRLTLTALYNHLFDEDFGNKHEASADVKALARVWIELLRREWV